ncbi:MAG TPA: PKD domain-containing protein, partial [Thermoplasmatales archaeon]|nr:PKD domain-containing protein [Thermoplasmatales archaeon]
WHRVYDSGCNDRAAALAVDSNNNIIVTGSSFIGGNTDYYTIKYDSDGTTTWNVTFDGSWRDKPYGITVDSEDNIIVTGRSAIHGSDDFYTIKYDNKGNIIWSRTYDEWNDEAQDVTVDFHDNVIIAGYTNHGENDDCCIIKYSRNGTLLWNISYDGGGDDKLYAVTTDTQNNIIAAGVSQTMLNGLAALIIKYTPDGEIVWENTTIADNNKQDFDVTVDSQNNIIVVGSITIMGKKYLNIRKYDAEGNLLWEKVDEKPNTEANGVTVDREDNILVVGRYQKYGGPDYYYIKKYYPNGNPVWEHLYNTGHEDYPRDITVDNHGDIIVTGYSAIGDHDYVTIKYTELFGNKTPKARFTYTPSTPQVFDTVQFTDQSMDPDGNVTSWTWDFGDNNISTEQNPSHRYEKSGIYIVSLTVTDNKGKPDSTQRIVVVESGENTERPIANFDYHPVNPQPGDTVEFIDTSTDFDGVITQRLWVFHDNSTATAENVTFTYTQNGTYPVTLIVMDNDGVSDVKQKNIVVYVNDGNQPPQANFTYTPASPTTDDTVQFIDESMDEDGYITQWLWNFGDNTTSSASHPTHRYTVNGTYIVTLT